MSKKRRLQEQVVEYKHWLVWLIYGCALLAVVTPILEPFLAVVNHTQIKTFSYQILVEVMLVAWIPLAVANKRYRPKWNALTISLLVFAGVTLMSLPFSLDPSLSFWSTTPRMSGVVTMLHHVAWLLVLSSILQTRKDWISLIKTSGIVSFAIMVAIIVRWTDEIQSYNVTKIFGNSFYMVSYALPHVFIGLFLWNQESSYKKYFWLCVSALSGFAVIISGSRSGILTILASALLVAAVLVVKSKLTRVKKVSLLALSVVMFSLLAGGFFLLRTDAGRGWVSTEKVMPRFISRIAFRDFGGDRLVLWRMALDGIAERPLFGWGNKQFVQVSTKYLNIAGGDTEVLNESWQDTAHNQYLDHLLSYGVIGFVAYMAMWLALAILMLGVYRRSDSRIEKRGVLILAVMFIAHLGYTIFIFDTPQQLMILFMMMALLIFMRQENSDDLPFDVRASIPLFVALLIPMTVFSWFAHGEHWIAQQHFGRGGGAVQAQNWNVAAQEFDTALNNERNPYQYELRTYLMEATRNSVDFYHMGSANDDGLDKYLAVVAAAASANVVEHPADMKALYLAIEAHRYNYKYDEASWDKAHDYAERYLEWAPDKFDGHMQMAELELLRDNYDEALKWYDSAYERHFRPSLQYGGFIKYRKACVYARMRDFKNVAAELEESVKVFPGQKDARLVLEMGQAVRPGDNLTGFETFLDASLTYFSDQPDILAAGARIYKVMGHDDMVRQVLDSPAMVEWGNSAGGRVEYEALRQELGVPELENHPL